MCDRQANALRNSRRLVMLALGTMIGAGCQPGPPLSASGPTPNHPASLTSGGGPVPARSNRGTSTPRSKSSEHAAIRFRDVSEATGITFVHCSGSSPEKLYPTANGSGVALFDYDGDGRLDIYFATTRNLPLDAPTRSQGNRLYRNRGDGTFEDVTDRAGVGFRGFCHGVAVGDINRDGFPDLYLTNLGPNVLYLNNGDGTFRDATANSGLECPLWSSGAAMLDYDNDGHLDLYVSCYGQWTYDGDHPFCGDPEKKIRTYCSPLSIPPQRHFLFRNRGDGTFEDKTEAAGILRRDGRGMGVVAADVDRDGWTDLFVANDLCPNFLFLNRGDGTFEDAGEVSGAACSEAGEIQAGMGVDAEDINGDGFPELFVTHFRNEYNTLYRNLGAGNFQDITASAGILQESLAEVGWGCALVDFDNDGWPDIFVANGHVDDNLAQLNQEVPYAEPSKVWRNLGGARFLLVEDPGPFFARNHVGRGAAFGDLDNDGDIDVVINRMDDRPAVLLNESNPGHWIRLMLIGVRSNRSAIGARVEVHAGGRVIHRLVKGGGSYFSSNDPRLLVGLGSAEQVDRVEIDWPGGLHSTLKSPAIGKTHQVREPDEQPAHLPAGRRSARGVK
jgi:enediyne biosynthesis protein E4